MDLGAAGLLQQPFPTHGKPLVTVAYASKTQALEVLNDTRLHPNGLSLIQAPALAGKSTLVRAYLDGLALEDTVAVIDGRGLNTANLLMSVLRQFGYDIELTSTNELMGLVRVFALQQTATVGAPMLILENAHELTPDALRALSELAELRVRQSSAVRMVLVSDRSLKGMMAAQTMQPIAERLLHDFHLRPMNRAETRHYLHAKLGAAGSNNPENVFPDEVCRDIWDASGGWPGIADRVALLALASSATLPVAVTSVEHPALPSGTWDDDSPEANDPTQWIPADPPRLIVTNSGSVINDMVMEKPRVLIGRSEHNDIAIPSRFVSRHHTLLVKHGASTFLMDLNSTNGTFVNSKRVSNHVLLHNDIITLGHHRIKFHDPYATSRGDVAGIEFADTQVMKTLADMRKLLARENTALLPAVSEDLPTIKT